MPRGIVEKAFATSLGKEVPSVYSKPSKKSHMSTNLVLKASVPAVLQTKNGETHRTITEYFDLHQTPTLTTQRILSSDNILKAYIDWIECTAVWATHTDSNAHIQEVQNWLYEHSGWNIEWTSW